MATREREKVMDERARLWPHVVVARARRTWFYGLIFDVPNRALMLAVGSLTLTVEFGTTRCQRCGKVLTGMGRLTRKGCYACKVDEWMRKRARPLSAEPPTKENADG